MTPAKLRAWLEALERHGCAYTGTIDCAVGGGGGPAVWAAETRDRPAGEWFKDGDGYDLTPAQLADNERRWLAGDWTPGRQSGNPVPVGRWPASWRIDVLYSAGRAFVEGRDRYAFAIGVVGRCESRHRETAGKPRSWRCSEPAGHYPASKHRSRSGHRSWAET